MINLMPGYKEGNIFELSSRDNIKRTLETILEMNSGVEHAGVVD
jgi:hypothetical protein